MLKIYTSQLRYGGGDRLDISVKSGMKILAPTWDLVMKFKEGRITPEQFSKEYTRLMRKSYTQYQEAWLALLRNKTITLVCYCPKDSFCHRHLLAPILVSVAKHHGVKAKYLGEVDP